MGGCIVVIPDSGHDAGLSSPEMDSLQPLLTTDGCLSMHFISKKQFGLDLATAEISSFGMVST